MRRIFRLLFGLCFALLQCVAPLAHAHIGGEQPSQHIHIHEVQELGNAPALSVDDTSVEVQDLPAVEMPKGKQRHTAQQVFFAPEIQEPRVSRTASTPETITFPYAGERLPSSRLLFPKQYPQAPPTFAA